MPCLDGSQSITLQALRGPMVLNVWGSWCYSCKTELPYFRDFYQSSLGKVQLVGVDVEEATIADARTFVVNQGMLWPSISDPDGRTRGHFGMGVPVTWFIAPDGSIKYKLIGPVHSAQELKDLTKKYLGIDIA